MYEKVERLMSKKGVKAADVAKAVGISSSVFTDWKKGRYTPKADKLYALAQYFDVPMEYFFDIDYLDKIAEQYKRYLEKHEKPLYRAESVETSTPWRC